MRSISLHWTAHGYADVFPAYHYCLTGPHAVVVHHTHDLRANMRDVRGAADAPYAAHTAGRNSWSIGLAIAAMDAATPANFGASPLTEPQLAALIHVAARLAAFYRIDVAAIRTHAEAALADGYFGAGEERVRWDIARLQASPAVLLPAEATTTGDWFRNRIAESIARLR